MRGGFCPNSLCLSPVLVPDEGVAEGVSEGSSYLSQPNNPRKPQRNTFKNPSKTFQEGVKIDDALGFRGLKVSSRVRGSCSKK